MGDLANGRTKRLWPWQNATCALLVSTIGAPLLVSAAPAQAQHAQLSVIGDSGLPGATVGVTIRLAHDSANAAATASLDIDFPTDRVEFIAPVSENCTIAARLAATHQIGGRLPQAGRLSFDIFARGLDVQALGDGELATCAFHILSGAAFGPAPLTVALVQLAGFDGLLLPVDTVDGVIDVTDGTPTPTPTVVPSVCLGDCDGDGQVTIDEIIRGVNIALGNLSLSTCAAADRDGDGSVTIAELIGAVNIAAASCPSASP